MFSFARSAGLSLAALGLDGRLASHKSPDIRAKENIRYELTQSQNNLTATGLLMEARGTHPTAARAVYAVNLRFGGDNPLKILTEGIVNRQMQRG